MNTYEQKRQARIERMRARAEKLDAIADQNSPKNLCGEKNTGIPFGQPIIDGHHSERRHRRHLERLEARLSKGFKAYDKAKDLRNKAVWAEKRTAIDSDNPEALKLLEQKLADLKGVKGAYASQERARLKKRIEAQKIIDSEFKPFEINCVRVELVDGQIQLVFPDKPSDEFRSKLKRSPLAFKWSRYSDRWVRKHTATTCGRYFQTVLREALESYEA